MRTGDFAVLHLHDKRCSLGIHESLVMIVTSFTLRSPCSWKLQCEMYVLQFYLNLFSVVLAQLRLTLRCRCIDASASTNPSPSPLYIYIFTRSHPQIYLSTSLHPHICTSISHLYIHTVAPSHLSFLSFFLSFFLHIFFLVSDLSTSIHLQIYIAPAHPHSHSFTSTLSFSLSIHLFDSAGQLHVSRSGQPSSSALAKMNYSQSGGLSP